MIQKKDINISSISWLSSYMGGVKFTISMSLKTYPN